MLGLLQHFFSNELHSKLKCREMEIESVTMNVQRHLRLERQLDELIRFTESKMCLCRKPLQHLGFFELDKELFAK